MIIKRIEGTTRVCGERQGYLGLPLRDVDVIDKTSGHLVPTMITAWEPTPAELAALNRGAAVHVQIFGNKPPPMIVEVGPVPE